MGCADPKPQFANSCIVPLNKEGVVLGAIALYRREKTSFSEEEFRRLEIVASQTGLALQKVQKHSDDIAYLTDSVTGIANAFHLYLLFDQVAFDADRYQYPLSLISIRLEELQVVRKKYGQLSGDEYVRTVTRYLRCELRDTDLLVRYSSDELVILAPRLGRQQAETLVSRIQNELDHFHFLVRSDVNIPIPVSMGCAFYPDDGTKIQPLVTIAEWRTEQDFSLRSTVKRRIQSISAPA
jgi:two-component system, cell cycle response regulator